jgi:hypothetical protein
MKPAKSGDPQLPGRQDLAAGEAAGEAGDVGLQPLGQDGHLLARRRRHIARAVPLEQARPEILLDLAEAAEHRRVV